MASTNKTTNYELSQFVETDRPAWLTDYNGDMRTLDTALKAVSDVASGASGSISSLADRMTAAEGGITTNANDIDALEARADSLEAQAQSSAGTIAGIQVEQIAQNAGIEAATELGYNLARPYDSANTYTVGDYVLFQNTLYKCVTAIATGEAFDPTKWLAIKATDEIAAGGYTLPIASANTLGGVKVGSGLNIDAAGVLSSSGTVPTPYNTVNGITLLDDVYTITPRTARIVSNNLFSFVQLTFNFQLHVTEVSPQQSITVNIPYTWGDANNKGKELFLLSANMGAAMAGQTHIALNYATMYNTQTTQRLELGIAGDRSLYGIDAKLYFNLTFLLNN